MGIRGVISGKKENHDMTMEPMQKLLMIAAVIGSLLFQTLVAWSAERSFDLKQGDVVAIYGLCHGLDGPIVIADSIRTENTMLPRVDQNRICHDIPGSWLARVSRVVFWIKDQASNDVAIVEIQGRYGEPSMNYTAVWAYQVFKKGHLFKNYYPQC